MREGFVDLREAIPGLSVEARYATPNNLTGAPMPGYDRPTAVGTVEMAQALSRALTLAKRMGFGLLVYDAYRPQRAVDRLVSWCAEPEDPAARERWHPAVPRDELIRRGYIAATSGHTRGSVVDLTLTDAHGVPLDMGTTFDFMDPSSGHPFRDLPEEVLARRATLRSLMAWAGFEPYECEWWHYRLMGEPYPDTYFDFPIE